MTRLLGHADEPTWPSAVVAVHYGDYRRQEIWFRSGLHDGTWYCLGGETSYGPSAVSDPRPYVEQMVNPAWRRPDGTIPPEPKWSDVLARGPVTLLLPGDDAAYRAGWRAGRHDLCAAMEELVEEPPDTP